MKHTAARFLSLLLVLLTLGMFVVPVMADGEPDIGSVASQLIPDMKLDDGDFAKIATSILAISSAEDANALLIPYKTEVPMLLFIVAVVALVLSLFGCKLLHLSLLVAGAALGWTGGVLLYNWLVSVAVLDPATMAAFVPYLFYAGGALIAMLISGKVLKLGIFLLSAMGAYVFVGGFTPFSMLVDDLVGTDFGGRYVVARILVALLAGLLAIWLEKIMLILMTSLGGGMVASFTFLVAIMPSDGSVAGVSPNAEIIIGLVIGLLGLLVQFKTNYGRSEKKED